MPVHRPGSVRPRHFSPAGLLLAALSLLLAALAVPASAADTPTRGSAHMGMGVLAHDGQNGTPAGTRAAQTEGVDVSGYQGNVDWTTLWNSGVRWAYTKATEGTYYTNPSFAQQYNGSYNVGMIRGAYHFATPDTTTGATQANYFVDHGGGWSRDGKTLPGALDIEYNPYGATCYGLSQSAMVSWIRDFLNTYKSRTGRDAVIYSNYNWWSTCTGNSTAFNATNPLWVARYSSTVGTLPGGWPFYTFWQYTSSPIDQNHFNGDSSRLTALANG
jgi:GH25 family lysozyme M1 (1,4-beta-N-acetylmuramidase)